MRPSGWRPYVSWTSSTQRRMSPTTILENWRRRFVAARSDTSASSTMNVCGLRPNTACQPTSLNAPARSPSARRRFAAPKLVSVPDLREDERFNQNPFVTGDPHLQFYCSMPLITNEGYALGTLCVMDFEPRRLEFEQAEAMRRLSRQVLSQLELRRKVIEYHQTIEQLQQARADAAAEKARTEELLVNILPTPIADELKKNGKVQPRYTNAATVLFTDFKGFTLLAERTEPAALIGLLDQYFTAFDDIVARCGLEKLKTVGDAYMAVAGVPRRPIGGMRSTPVWLHWRCRLRSHG